MRLLLAPIIVMSLQAGFSGRLVAQAVPFSAKSTITEYRIMPDGSRKLVNKLEGVYLRMPNGSELRTFKDSLGSAKMTGTYVDADAKIAYHVDYLTHQAVVKQHITGRFPRVFHSPAANLIAGTQVVNGTTCELIRNPLNGLQNDTCVLEKENIVVKSEYEQRWAGGAGMHTVEELSDLRVGDMPNQNDVKLPPNFTIVGK